MVGQTEEEHIQGGVSGVAEEAKEGATAWRPALAT
jgi:hypothetical protein